MAGSRNWKNAAMNNGYFQSDWQDQNHALQIYHKSECERASYTDSVLSRVCNNESCGWWDYVEFRNEAGERGGGRQEGQEWRIKSSFGVKVFDRTGRNYQLVTLQNVGPRMPQGTLGSCCGWLIVQRTIFTPRTQMHATRPSVSLPQANTYDWVMIEFDSR